MAARVSVSTYEDYPYESLLEYAGIDCIVTSDLLAKLMPAMASRPAYQLSQRGVITPGYAPSVLSEQNEIKKRALEFAVHMEVTGIQYDVPLNRAMNVQMLEDLNVLNDRLRGVLGNVNFDSDRELSEVLFGRMKMSTSIRTQSGGMSCSGDALKEMYEKYGHDWLKDLGKRNDIRSIHSSFISTYPTDWVKRDGRVHPSYNLFGTSSHRISSDSPNLLNLPRPMHGYNIRKCYTVKMGHVFVTFDFSSCEVKVLAALCRDKKMLEAIHSGLDFHSYTASTIHGIPYDEFVEILETKSNPLSKVYKEYRQGAKAVTFGILYGSSLGGIAMTLGVTLQEATSLVALYFDTFPDIKLFVDDCHNMAKLNAMVFSPFGQRKMEFGAYPCFKGTAVHNAALRNAQNVRIQGPASTLGLMAFAEMTDRNQRYRTNTMATVYDSIEMEAPLKNVAQVIENGFVCMDDWPQEAYDWLDFPIGADAEIGFDWGDLAKVHRGITQEEVERILQEMNPVKYAECLRAA